MIIETVIVIIILSYLANRYYFSGGKYYSNKRLDGKVAIITGANTGIGYETALDFARRGARVILACRDTKKAEKACEKIKNETGNKDVQVEYLDLADLETVTSFCLKMNSELDKLDFLINNAGVLGCFGKTKQGFEMHFGVNHLAHFLLTNLLLDLLKKTSNSRIVTVSSIAHYGFTLNWDEIESGKMESSMRSYSESKLANILFTKELAKRLQGTSVTAVCLHPGTVRSELFRYTNDGWFRLMRYILKIFHLIFLTISKTPHEGAMTTIYCSLDDKVSNFNGYYFSDCKPKKPHINARNSQDALKLWNLSSRLVNLQQFL